MGITKMFRDRVVSLEQTYELGEKQIDLLAELIAEALPGIERTEYELAHEIDQFVVMAKSADNNATKRVAFTRMVLADSTCLPAIAETKKLPARDRLVDCIREQSAKDEILVTFRAVMSEEERAEAEEIDAEWR